MPFGAEILAAGGVRFRLWAPAARNVDLITQDHACPMERTGDWFECRDSAAGPGTQYRYRIDGELFVPDPASRFQPQDVDGPSEVIDPRAYQWSDHGWNGRPWNEAVIYELHVGTFSPQGTFDGVKAKLPQLAELGITAIELMPLSDFAGKRNWGYDGVLPYAPDCAYGRPEDLKALIDAAHARGLMVLLDVVYNHFGPKGNYLPRYAPKFFTERHKTPWGAAIDFTNDVVRQYFVHNVLYWLEEYRFDGLRFDAVHAIIDDSPRHILDEIAAAAPAGKHLVLENDANQARFLGPKKFAAFKDPKVRERIPDPLAESTFKQSALDWGKRDSSWLAHYKQLLHLRQRAITPRKCGPGKYRMLGQRAFEVKWDGLTLVANCGDQKVDVKDAPRQAALWSNGEPGAPWSVNWWTST
jgi:malto-oligosyltrehalose trehalohydrolase